jgi:hypothetical protein
VCNGAEEQRALHEHSGLRVTKCYRTQFWLGWGSYG